MISESGPSNLRSKSFDPGWTALFFCLDGRSQPVTQHSSTALDRHLPVVTRGVPIGMISERDVLFHRSWHESDGHENTHDLQLAMVTRVENVMTTPAVVLSLDDPVAKADAPL